MHFLRDQAFRRVTPPSSSVDGIATVAVAVLLAIALVIIVAVLIVAGAVTARPREQPQPRLAPHVTAPPYALNFAERGR